MAQWIRRLPTEQEIPGSSPGRGLFCFSALWVVTCQKTLKALQKFIPGGTRTRNPQIRSLMRYPLRHRDSGLGKCGVPAECCEGKREKRKKPDAGLEPAANRLRACHSTD
jgi:hypothetical protein